jgi:peptidoglycan hydrolase-like protein with peptidoglycan-binding domain
MARSISAPVGAKGLNLKADVRIIQELLNASRANNAKYKAAGIARLAEDGDIGPKTIEAISAYQLKVMGWTGDAVDGTVHPNRTTWKSLNGNVGGARGEATSKEVTPSTMVAGYVMFKQGDFKSTQLGSGALNVSGHGCALCTLTMAATAIGTATEHWPKHLNPRDLTPPKSNDIIKAAGGFSGSLLKMGVAAGALGMTYDEFGRTSDLKGSDVSWIESHLAAGFPVAGQVDYKSSNIGDHWILIARRGPNATFDAIDPATGRLVTLTKAPMSSIGDPKGGPRTDAIAKGVLFGWGQGGSNNQMKYVVVRFALLAPLSGGYCASF